MSGDVQPRRRKDRKKKRDEDDTTDQHYGVHTTKMGIDDVHIHIHSENGTGGHWCAKIFFFSLLSILAGLIGLIIIENRGLADLDTPLSESRFSNYFEGWVDEIRDSHDEYDAVAALIEKHEHDDKPFEEEEVQEVEESETEEQNDDSKVEDEEHTNQDEEKEDNVDDNGTQEEDGHDYEPELEPGGIEKLSTDETESAEYTDKDMEENSSETKNLNFLRSSELYLRQDGDEEDDAGTIESLEKITENDNEELFVMQEKARQKSAIREVDEFTTEEETESSFINSLAVKVGVGLALAVVARVVLVSKNPNTSIESNPSTEAEGENDELVEEELRKSHEQLLRENFDLALAAYASLSLKYPVEAEDFIGLAMSFDRLSRKHLTSQLIKDDICHFKKFVNFKDKNNKLHEFKKTAESLLERMRSIGYFTEAIYVHRILICLFFNDSSYANQLAITYLMANRLADAKLILTRNLKRWPNDGFAMAHYGYVLINLNEKLEEAVTCLQKGIESGAPGTQDGRLLLILGDTWTRLGRADNALKIFRRGVDLNIFPSFFQRSLYNVPGLKAQPFWTIEESTYSKFFKVLESNSLKIREEGLSVLNSNGYFLNESENLKHFGEWKQFILFSCGQRLTKNCMKAPFTCRIIETFPAARFCKRGQIKFSVLHPGTHIWPHCGPTNCRLRAHLGLKIPPNTLLRAGNETRVWTEGKFLIFDDSFEHEIWQNGTELRLILIVDVWHPELSEEQRQNLLPL